MKPKTPMNTNFYEIRDDEEIILTGLGIKDYKEIVIKEERERIAEELIKKIDHIRKDNTLFRLESEEVACLFKDWLNEVREGVEKDEH